MTGRSQEAAWARTAQDEADRDDRELARGESPLADTRSRPLSFEAAVVLVTLAAGLASVLYWAAATSAIPNYGNCGGDGFLPATGYWHGGPYAGPWTGLVAAGALWMVALFGLRRFPRRRVEALGGFVLLLPLVLVLLWFVVAPAAWGAATACP
jgi:hypothetical protein